MLTLVYIFSAPYLPAPKKPEVVSSVQEPTTRRTTTESAEVLEKRLPRETAREVACIQLLPTTSVRRYSCTLAGGGSRPQEEGNHHSSALSSLLSSQLPFFSFLLLLFLLYYPSRSCGILVRTHQLLLILPPTPSLHQQLFFPSLRHISLLLQHIQLSRHTPLLFLLPSLHQLFLLLQPIFPPGKTP